MINNNFGNPYNTNKDGFMCRCKFCGKHYFRNSNLSFVSADEKTCCDKCYAKKIKTTTFNINNMKNYEN